MKVKHDYLSPKYLNNDVVKTQLKSFTKNLKEKKAPNFKSPFIKH